jgi:hypothetical protein
MNNTTITIIIVAMVFLIIGIIAYFSLKTQTAVTQAQIDAQQNNIQTQGGAGGVAGTISTIASIIDMFSGGQDETTTA